MFTTALTVMLPNYQTASVLQIIKLTLQKKVKF